MLQFLSPAEDLIRRFNPFAPTARRAEDPRPEVHVYHMLGLRNGQIVHRPPHQANPAGLLGGLHTFQPRTFLAWKMLNEKLVYCPALSSTGKPSRSTAQLAKPFHSHQLSRLEWQRFYPLPLMSAYLNTVRNGQLRVHFIPQLQCLLETEGDVGDTIMYNVLAPVVDLLNDLIAPCFRRFFEVGIQHQSKPLDGSQSISIDHVLTVLDRRGLTSSTAGDNRRSRINLVIVEEKKAGYVRPDGWVFSFLELNAEKLMPQVMMYAHYFECQRFVLTDYEQGIAVHLIPSERPGLTVVAAAHTCNHAQGGYADPHNVLNDPMNMGLRNSVTFLAISALNELGILDYTKVRIPQNLVPQRLDPRAQAIVQA